MASNGLKEQGLIEIKVIGCGQYGKAYLVRSEKDQQHYIAKTIDLTWSSKKEHDTANLEVQLLRTLDHPNIVEYKDSFFSGDMLVIVMQYCEGGDLSTYIKSMAKAKQRIREQQIMHYLIQMLHALKYIHRERILHRDLKSSNLFLTNQCRVVKLGDFGISRVLEGTIEAAMTVVGTPYYMSPEVCENRPYSYSSDVWSLGCVLYELCVLKHAFSADNLLGLVYKIVSDEYEAIPKVYSKGPLSEFLRGMLAKDPDRRPTVQQLLDHPAVQSFAREYVSTRGQCATPSAQPPVRRPSGPRGSEPLARQAPPRPAARGAPAAKAGPARTPKELALARKQAAADKRAAELAAASSDALVNRSIAAKMKDREFHSTRASSTASSTAWPVPEQPKDVAERGFEVMHAAEEPQSAEEISSDDSFSDSLDSYSSDFEDDDDLRDDFEAEQQASADGRVDRDLARCMSNYERDHGIGVMAAPPPRSDALPVTPLDSGARLRRQQEDLMSKLGEDQFRKAFEYLLRARDPRSDLKESVIKRQLEQIIGREAYKKLGLNLDQLVYQTLMHQKGK